MPVVFTINAETVGEFSRDLHYLFNELKGSSIVPIGVPVPVGSGPAAAAPPASQPEPAPAREPGKPAPGRSRRTKAEIEEDKAREADGAPGDDQEDAAPEEDQEAAEADLGDGDDGAEDDSEVSEAEEPEAGPVELSFDEVKKIAMDWFASNGSDMSALAAKLAEFDGIDKARPQLRDLQEKDYAAFVASLKP